jgi:HAD superfamily hydrolase (TIGR01509 family)
MTGGLRAVLFDMDGLLVDSEPLWYEAERTVMARLGSPWTPADQHHLLGSTLERAVAYMLGKAARPADPAQVGHWLVEAVTGLVTARGVPLLPGAAELLAEVAAAGVAHALVTSAQRRFMTAVLAATGLEFGVTVCGEDVRAGKPDPEPYLHAAALLGEPPGCCVVLEDSASGVAAAEAAGCPVIAVPSAPLPPRPGRPLARSLLEVDLPRLRRVAAGFAAGSPSP